MSVDERDYMIDRIRKRDRYVERSAFRISEKEKRRLAARRVWLKYCVFVVLIILVAVLWRNRRIFLE